MGELKYERMLRIRTTGLREWKKQSHYNRYEATPYKALDRLFQSYKIKESDEVVDYGSGRGRVSFYIHNRFQVPVKGVEVNDLTYEEALENKANYRVGAKHIPAPIRFEYGLAEQYEIEETDNCFYFFNPFSVQIFKKVVQNILRSVDEHKRTVDIILYYPMPEYKAFLKKTPFKLVNKVVVPESIDRKDKFLIYRYECE